MANQVSKIEDIEFGEELPAFDPDTSLDNVKRFGEHVGWGGGRFTDHEAARKEGFPGAIIPGVMSQGFLGAMIHRWAPKAQIITIDTIFRAPVLVDQPHHINGVVTNIEEDDGLVEIDITVTNEANETRVLGTATIKL
ncbi:MAG: MaoC/PaaZ C-terminal domain-containing protein [Gammaproteobacteria bacterium]|nr:MaoC/PaaZ C-terminal domain-containing protein [Gammaproteobacteria bacterium]